MKGPTEHKFYACEKCDYLTDEVNVIEHWPEWYCNHPDFKKPTWVENPHKGVSKEGCPMLGFRKS